MWRRRLKDMDKDNKNTELNDTDKKLHISDVSIQYCDACEQKRKHTKKKYGLECNICGWLKEQY